jgi:RNA polymerase sigma-70 factor (ECF subfamily)
MTEDDAADLTQQVFVDALHALAQYSPRRGPFAAWLFGIARHIASDFHHRQRRTVTWDLVPQALQPLATQDVEAGLLHHEAVARLRLLFTRLDADKRELLVLRFVAQLTVAEIAAVVGKSEAATQKAMYRVIQTLKEHYHDEAR